jgi:hypothetical protein
MNHELVFVLGFLCLKIFISANKAIKVHITSIPNAGRALWYKALIPTPDAPVKFIIWYATLPAPVFPKELRKYASTIKTVPHQPAICIIKSGILIKIYSKKQNFLPGYLQEVLSIMHFYNALNIILFH